MPASSSRPLPFARNYGVNLTIALLALIPFIVITTAGVYYESQIITVIGSSKLAIDTITWLGTAAYAFGALLGGDLIQRYPQRRLFLFCEGLFVAGTVLAMFASETIVFGVGTVLQGFATGLLLVIALPPVIRRFPVEKLTLTAAFIDIAFFGAIAAGPMLGGAVAVLGAWRRLYGIVAAIGVATIVTAGFTLPYEDPPSPQRRFDSAGIALGLAGTFLPFWAVGNLTAHGFTSVQFLAPFVTGIFCFGAMLLVEFHEKDPISPVKAMWNSFPVAGVIASMIGGGIYFTLYMLAQQYQTTTLGVLPLPSGISFWPQIVGIVVGAITFRFILNTRYLAVFTLTGMVALLLAGAILIFVAPDGSLAMTRVVFGLMGFGAGATVAPGLWMAGLSLKSQMIGRIFALVELVRSEANFLMAPIIIKIAQLLSGGGSVMLASGVASAAWITVLAGLALTIVGIVIFAAGGGGLQRPNLRAWHDEDKTAWTSPELFALARGKHPDQQLRKAS